MKVCDNCGVELSDDLLFCPKCGSKIDSDIFSYTNQKINEIKSNVFDFSKKSRQISDNWADEKAPTNPSGDFIKSSKKFIENTGNIIVNIPPTIFESKENQETSDNQMDDKDALAYLRKNKYTIIEFAVSDDDSKEKLTNLLSADLVGGGAGLIGAASTVGILGVSLGTGLIAVGALALVGGVLAKNYDNVSWVESELFIWDDELVISGKFSIPYNEIKHIDIKNIDSDGIIVLTLKDQVIEFKAKNSEALKTIIDEKLMEHYK